MMVESLNANVCNRNDCNGRCRESETDKVPYDEDP